MQMSLSSTNSQAGFTLLEMVVVMVLLGLISSLTLPAMQRWHSSLIARSEASSIVQALQAAAFQAGVQRLSKQLDADSFTYLTSNALPQRAEVATVGKRTKSITLERAVITIPPGWRVGRVVPAVFGADGLCKPGMAALLSSSDTALIFTVHGPICRIEWTRDHSATTRDYRAP